MSSISLSFGPFIWVSALFTLWMVQRILHVALWWGFCCWVCLREVFLFFWGNSVLNFSFISIWWCPLPNFLGTCNFLFPPVFLYFPDIVVLFLLFSHFHYQPCTFFNATFHSYILNILIICKRFSSSFYFLASIFTLSIYNKVSSLLLFLLLLNFFHINISW